MVEQWIDWKPQPGDIKPERYRIKMRRCVDTWDEGKEQGRQITKYDLDEFVYQIPAPVVTQPEDRPPWIDPQCKFRWGDRVKDRLGRVWFVIHPYDKDAAKYHVVIAKSLSTAAPYSTEKGLKALGLWWNNPVDAYTESVIELFPEELPQHFDDRLLDADQPQEQPKVARVPREIWVNIYPDTPLPSGGVHETRDRADRLACTDRIECAHFREVI